MIMSRNGNAIQISGTLWGESNSDQWTPLRKSLQCGVLTFFLVVIMNKMLNKHQSCQWSETSQHSKLSHRNPRTFCPCIKSLWPSDTIWRHRSWSTLAQVMACCLTAPSHYLNQCWLITSKVQWHSWRQFHKRYLHHQSLKSISKWLILNFIHNLPRTRELIKST